MEHVRVTFLKTRIVYIDGNESGITNKILRVGTGTHSFHLGEPLNYQPDKIIKQITDTDPLDPEIIEFKEL